MVRLSPKETYKASVKDLVGVVNNAGLRVHETREMICDGARLDYFMKSDKFLVTITSTYSKPQYAPIDRFAGTKAAQEKAQITAA